MAAHRRLHIRNKTTDESSVTMKKKHNKPLKWEKKNVKKKKTKFTFRAIRMSHSIVYNIICSTLIIIRCIHKKKVKKTKKTKQIYYERFWLHPSSRTTFRLIIVAVLCIKLFILTDLKRSNAHDSMFRRQHWKN